MATTVGRGMRRKTQNRLARSAAMLRTRKYLQVHEVDGRLG